MLLLAMGRPLMDNSRIVARRSIQRRGFTQALTQDSTGCD